MFVHSLIWNLRQIGKKYHENSSVSGGSFWRKTASVARCLSQFPRTAENRAESDKLCEKKRMSSVYSNQRPGFWNVPKFKSKESQGAKKKVHFYDDFVSALRNIFQCAAAIPWQKKATTWQVLLITWFARLNKRSIISKSCGISLFSEVKKKLKT